MRNNVKSRRIVVSSALAVAALGASALFTSAASADGREVRALVKNTSGRTIGTVTMTEQRGVVLVRARIGSLTEGFHGFHVHSGGACFTSGGTANFGLAGGHYATGGAHGAHAGDMPSLLAMADGTADLRFKTDAFSVSEVTGRTIIVHDGRDNFGNIPTRYHSHTTGAMGPDTATEASGDAGNRGGCGVIETVR